MSYKISDVDVIDDSAQWKGFSLELPSGTITIFSQTNAPTGWTKNTTHDNKAIRVVSGTVSTGGSSSFTNTFKSYNVGANGTVNAFTAVNKSTTDTGSVTYSGGSVSDKTIIASGTATGTALGAKTPTGSISATGKSLTSTSLSSTTNGPHSHTFGISTLNNGSLSPYASGFQDRVIVTGGSTSSVGGSSAAHTHTLTNTASFTGTSHTHAISNPTVSFTGIPHTHTYTPGSGTYTADAHTHTQDAHTHTFTSSDVWDLSLQYVDVIMATKD